MKKIIMATGIIMCLIILINMSVYVIARYGWRLFGFDSCITPDAIITREIIVDDGIISLKGETLHSAPSYVGYVHEVKGDKLYVGLKYNTLFGFSEPNAVFDIQINCDTEALSQIYFKNGDEERLIWDR